jgi:TolB-like protein
MNVIRQSLLLLAMMVLTGCSVIQSQQGAGIPEDRAFAVLPLENLSQTPRAGDQAASVLAAILRAKGSDNVTLYMPDASSPLLYDNSQRHTEARRSARRDGAEYLVSGTVEEWRYKSGLDGEPAVGVTLEIRSAENNRVIWSATSARTGWGRESVSVAAHHVLDELTDAMALADGD